MLLERKPNIGSKNGLISICRALATCPDPGPGHCSQGGQKNKASTCWWEMVQLPCCAQGLLYTAPSISGSGSTSCATLKYLAFSTLQAVQRASDWPLRPPCAASKRGCHLQVSIPASRPGKLTAAIVLQVTMISWSSDWARAHKACMPAFCYLAFPSRMGF